MAYATGVETSACTLVLLTLSSCLVYLGQAETTVSNTKLILKCSGYPNKRCSSLAILCYQDMFKTPRRCGPLCDGMEHFSIDEEQCLDYCGDFVDKYCQLYPKTSPTTPQTTTPQMTTPQLTTTQMTTPQMTTPQLTTLQMTTTQINAGLTKPKVATVTAPQTTSQLTTNSRHTPMRKDPITSQPPSSSTKPVIYTTLVSAITLVAVGIVAIAVIVRRRQRKEKKIQKELRSNKMTKDVEKRLLGQAESSV